MNDQIKELEQQCWEVRQYNPPWFNATKFAELIVKECANIVWDEAEKTMSSEVNDAGYKIIEYFGVEE